MYLKSLELFGFKSFAQKTMLDFHPGVTAVVGPNGCGKSNVLDAIRWVLGEQSAKALRGGEMSDVIFNGTDSRPALGMAEVSLTFADCEKDLGVEWHEVRITRRVYRDGKADYLLNKTPCRLKDIHQLFMDTGIGRTAYSIMEQGKIDQILSSRPEDRRAVFEEAAGITKYKTQKKEALRKLEYTEANLMRVTDIIKEVKRQIGSLQRQAGKARRYQSLLQDLRTLDTHLSRRNYDDLDRDLTAAAQAIARHRELHAGRELEIEQQENTLHGRRHDLDLVEQQISSARQQVQELKNRSTAAESRIGFNRERASEFAALAERYRLDIAAAEEKLRVQETQIEATDAQIGQLLLALETDETRLSEETSRVAETRTRRQDIQRHLDELIQSSNRTESALIRARAELSSAVSQREGAEARLARIIEDLRLATENRERLSTQVSTTRGEITRSRESLDRKRDELRLADIALTDARKAHADLGEEINRTGRTLAEKDSRLEVLRQLNDTGEGFNEGTQAILRGLDNPEFFKPAVLGALAAQIDVPADFIPAIEAALGQNLQAIVIKDSMVAESVLQTLSDKQLGRASVSAPEWMPRPSASQIEALPEGALCWALDRVQASPQVTPLLHRLLDHTVFAPSLEVALRIRNDHPRLAIATLAGEVITPEGIVHGGKAGQNSGGGSVLERKLQIHALDVEASALRSTLAALTTRREEAATVTDSAAAHLQSVRDELQQAQVAVSTLEGQLSLLDRELRETTGKFETLEWEQNSVTDALRATTERFGDLESQISSHQAALEESAKQRQILQSEAAEILSREEQLAGSLNDLRVTVATGRQHRDNLQRERGPMTSRAEELRDLIAQRRLDIEGYAERDAKLAAENAGLETSIAALREETAASEAEVDRITTSRAELATALAGLDASLRTARRELSDIQEQRGREEVRQTQLQLRLEHVAEHVRQRYNLDITAFSPDFYAFHCSVREQRKLRGRKPATSGQPEDSADPNATAGGFPAEVPAAELTVEDIVESAEDREAVDWAFVGELVGEMTEKLDSMGPVNLEAIQEYDELEERHKFLEEQYTDLTNSKAELLEVIQKINITTRQLFSDTFEQVRVNFKTMFTELFGAGSNANLILADEHDPLESGIEIIAKPPGKQLQQISLLSGGEKTMTAVALLFSIYMVKPAPFCVLDEMDAPLDESNINRFIKILDRFVSQSQFVVITHNKRTIAKADILYGVTMEEHGVSKLVGVKLTKRENTRDRNDLIGTENNSLPDRQPVPGTPGEARPEVPSIAESFGKKGTLHSEETTTGSGQISSPNSLKGK